MDALSSRQGLSRQQVSSPEWALDEALRLAPKPTSLEQTGLGLFFLADLLSKHLLNAGVLDLKELADRVALPLTVIEDVLAFLRDEGRSELRARRDQSPLLRFGLTDRGRAAAQEAMRRDAYVGPAPVSLADYERIVRAQSMKRFALTRGHVRETFADTVIRPDLLDRLAPAMHSGRSLFVYGPAGTGKSFISRRLARLLGPPVIIPHAVLVAESVISYFDRNVHRPVPDAGGQGSVLLTKGFDARYVLCERPFVASGGELTLDMLDLQYDHALHRYTAPLQMRANTGLLLIDDLGRQRVTPADLFNRWIVPLEELRDQLTLNTGQHFSIPFDLVLIFSTNLDPHDLADDAFLRRIGYKVRFAPSTREEYVAIWRQECARNGVEGGDDLVQYLLDDLYPQSARPLLACHPRDLLGLALDFAQYEGSGAIDREALEWAWKNYFVEIEV